MNSASTEIPLRHSSRVWAECPGTIVFRMSYNHFSIRAPSRRCLYSGLWRSPV